MLSLLFSIGIIVLVFKLIVFSFKATFGIAKVILFVVGLPFVLIMMFIGGLIYLSIPLLLIALAVLFLSPFFTHK